MSTWNVFLFSILITTISQDPDPGVPSPPPYHVYQQYSVSLPPGPKLDLNGLKLESTLGESAAPVSSSSQLNLESQLALSGAGLLPSSMESCLSATQHQSSASPPKYPSSLSSKPEYPASTASNLHQLSSWISPPASDSARPSPGTSAPPPPAPDSLSLSSKARRANIKEDETLKLLKKYYLEALLAQQMDSSKMPYERENVSWEHFLEDISLKFYAPPFNSSQIALGRRSGRPLRRILLTTKR